MASIDISGIPSIVLGDVIEIDHKRIVPGTVVQFVRKGEKRVVIQLAGARREPWFRAEASAKRGELRFRFQDLAWFEAASHHVDDSKPLLYMWEIFDGRTPEFRYVGKSVTGAYRPRKDYRQNVRRLLAGQPYRPSDPTGFRKIHHELKRAAIGGWDVRLTLLRNVLKRENIFDAEREAQVAYNVAQFTNASEA